jgi:hypothetical protein
VRLLLHIDERLTNEGKTTLDIMWGHHIAFGLPFMKDGVQIETNAKTFSAEPSTPSDRKFKPGNEFNWPLGEGINEKQVDASVIGDVNAGSYSELCYLKVIRKKHSIPLKVKISISVSPFDGMVVSSLAHGCGKNVILQRIFPGGDSVIL